jgi:hypothetical protein
MKFSLRAHRPALLLMLTSITSLALFAADASATTAAAKSRQGALTLYSVATAEQFINNEDDRARGKGNSPFGNYKDTSAVAKQAGNGPFAGDESLFTFNVYTSSDLKTKIGTASFTCQYNFNKNAFCESVYTLKHGTLYGAGAFNFNASAFSIAITAGTGTYNGKTGQMAATPGPNHSQQLVFRLS